MSHTFRSRALIAGLALMLCALTACTNIPIGNPGSGRVSVVFIPYWDQPRAIADAIAHRDEITDASPWWFTVDAKGTVGLHWAGATYADTANVRALQNAGIRVTPVIATGDWDYTAIAAVLKSATRRAGHITAIVNLVTKFGYDGIDIDYENLHSGDRASFSAFITDLGRALHSKGKILAADLFSKTTDAGYDQRNVAQDYRTIGKAVDQFRLMGYDWHWSTSSAGPIGPVGWLDDVLSYATSQAPASKVVLLAGMYGYDWVGKKGTDLTWDQVVATAVKTHATVEWDATNREPHFTYMSGTTRHDVWFENGQSFAAKLGVAGAHHIGGVGVWRLGGEDPGIWPDLSSGW